MKMVDPQAFFAERNKLKHAWNWKRTNKAFKGHAFHKKMQDAADIRQWVMNPFTEQKYDLVPHSCLYDNESRCENLIDLPDGAYTELLVFNLDLWIAGQVDEVFIKTERKKRKIWINDHKTNDERPDITAPEYCYEPFDDLYNSKHVKYSVQISLYSYLMELAGFEVQEIGYTFYPDYKIEEAELIPVGYMQKVCTELVSI